jgi:transcriptional regulator with XRE-family HTH domain
MRARTILQKIGQEVRERRKQHGLSQEALAHMSGVHTNVIGRLERGSYNPTVLTLHSVAHHLDVPMHELLTSAARR